MKVFIIIKQAGIFHDVKLTREDAELCAKECEENLGFSGSMDTRVNIIEKEL